MFNLKKLKGNCTAPDTCTCNVGYSLSVNKKCEPVCADGCDFGDCIAPGQCSCRAGYEKINKKCEPICSRYIFSYYHNSFSTRIQ